MPFRRTSGRSTSRQPRAGLVVGSGWTVVRSLVFPLCLVLGGADARRDPAFAAANAAAPAVAGAPIAGDSAAAPHGAARFAMTPAARGTLQALWRSSVRANEERVACLGGARGEDGVVRITRVYLLVPAAADSANASAGPSLATCGPPRWFGTVHTHIITDQAGEPYTDFSSPDRDVMARWEQAWRAEGVFCLLYSGAAAHCVSGSEAAATLTYAPTTPAASRAPRMVAADR